MQTKAKSNSVVTTKAVDGGKLEFTVIGHSPVVFDPAKCHADNRIRAEMHGWIQRIVDTAAVSMTDKAGAIVPKETRTAQKAEAIQAIILHYESGTQDWSRKAVAPVFDSALVLEAIARAQSVDVACATRITENIRIKRQLATTEECLKYLSTGSDVRRCMLEIQATRIRPVTDADSDLSTMALEMDSTETGEKAEG